ncbi:MAG: hypothetical protein LBS85_06255 [Clostridiales Family XIII bacterium]|jgi:hypothetical protein|nr:hypothetical protein [Clostridiales Family XIII bacterium]
MNSKRVHALYYIALIAGLAVLFYLGSLTLFILVYVGVFIFVSARVLQSTGRLRHKLQMMIVFLFCLVLQIVVCVMIDTDSVDTGFEAPLRKAIATLIVLLPILVSRYVLIGRHADLYLPSISEVGIISFAELRANGKMIRRAVLTAKDTMPNLSPVNFAKVIKDFMRHDLFNYINEGYLTPLYFEHARATLTDPYLYIIISNTGTPAAEILQVITQKQFNHASLSFDAELETTLSYNGGANLYPPGLNLELVETLAGKPGASILVYRLPCTCGQKATILDHIEKINAEGSAYNLIGLMTNRSYKPNMMFCSQFVWKMLEIAGLQYFTAPSGVIKPIDLIEKDYLRKLEFAYELKLDEPPEPGQAQQAISAGGDPIRQ